MLSRSASAAVAAAVRRAGASAASKSANGLAAVISGRTTRPSSTCILRRPRAVAVSTIASAHTCIDMPATPAAAIAAAAAVSTSAPRCFSSTTASGSSDSSGIPTRHSRHVPRPVCADSEELESTTASLLASRPGSLFAYEFNSATYNGGKGSSSSSRSSSSSSSRKADEYEAGLARSDMTTQKFEWTLGGHAAAIPGTLAASAASTGSTASADSSNSKQHLDAMVGLLERIEEEGRVYVELRARVLNQHYNDNNTAAPDSSSSDGRGSESSSDSSSDSDTDTDTDASSASSAQSQSAWRIQSLINRYGATPGPSIYMYDALLDAIACCAESEQDNRNAGSSMEYLALARSVYERAMARHHADGGPNANNRLTMPTLVTYNAVLRTCAAVQYDADADGSNDQVQVRDAALDLAFVVYDALNANAPADPASTSNAVSKNKSSKMNKAKVQLQANAKAGTSMPQRNAATYAHMLRLIAKYLSPSPTRGNVAYGLWLSCTGHDGVLDRQVIQAYVEANNRNGSNGPQYDAFVAKVTGAGAGAGASAGGANGMQENDVLRQNWWRNRKSRRMAVMNGGEGMADSY